MEGRRAEEGSNGEDSKWQMQACSPQEDSSDEALWGGESRTGRPLSSRVPAWGGRDVSVSVLGLPAAQRVRQMNGKEAVIIGSRACGGWCQGQSWVWFVGADT